MRALDNSEVLDYSADQNLLNAVVGFVYAGGSGYTSAPTVAFSGGGGSGAAATAVLTNGRVTGLTITNGGTGYTSAPTIAFTGGGGTGAAGTALLTGTAVSGATITTGGTGGSLTITDLTAYPSGDSRKAINISVFDKFGHEADGYLDNATASIAIDLLGKGINAVDGLDAIATVVSTLDKVKDGTVKGIGSCKTSGNFVMEH